VKALFFSVIAMLVKFAGALSGFIIGLGLTFSGYIPNEVQSESTVFGLKIVMLLLPTLFVLSSAVFYVLFYKLHGADYSEMLTAGSAPKAP
jgi:melibiose permease